jgi:selenocysteine-specific elongation factor
MPREGLRAPLAKAAAIGDFNALLLWAMGQGSIVAEGARGVRLPEHEVKVPEGWKRPAEEIREVYQAARFLPPAPDNFQANYPRDVNVRAILSILAENGELVPLAEDLYLHRDAFAEAQEIIRRLAGTPEGITVGTVRDATGSSRKVILPLLEYLDAHRFTRRVGDTRILVES